MLYIYQPVDGILDSNPKIRLRETVFLDYRRIWNLSAEMFSVYVFLSISPSQTLFLSSLTHIQKCHYQKKLKWILPRPDWPQSLRSGRLCFLCCWLQLKPIPIYQKTQGKKYLQSDWWICIDLNEVLTSQLGREPFPMPSGLLNTYCKLNPYWQNK